MSKKRIIGIIGEANLKADKLKGDISFQLGKLLADNGYFLATGGMGGVMASASQGARSSSNYKEGMVIGVLPDYSCQDINEFVDVAIPTGMGLARNIILVSMCDAVIAVGGRSGTLSEIALAWQMGKLVIAMDTEGWSGNLKSVKIDSRRNDEILSAKSAEEAIEILLNKINDYPLIYSGVQRARIDKYDAIKVLKTKFNITTELKFLGEGNEGYVFTDNNFVYKLIEKDSNILELYWKLKALSEDIGKTNTKYCINFDVFKKENYLLIMYQFVETTPYKGECLNHLVSLAKEMKQIGWLTTNFHPNNVRILIKENIPVIVDIGHSFEPYHEELFRKMCRRMFVSSILGDCKDIGKYLSETNESEDFIGLEDFGFDSGILQDKFKAFFTKIMISDKKELLNPVIEALIEQLHDVSTIFDYGSGHGDIAKMLSDKGLKVTAYDVDQSLYEKYKETYYQGIKLLSNRELQSDIKGNKKFDCVLSSLVFCHPLDEDKNQRDEIVKEIIQNIVALSSRYVIIGICNPLYTAVTNSGLQERILPSDFFYSKENKVEKIVKTTNSHRIDYHRPISFYEKLFADNDLKILRIEQTVGENLITPCLFYSDFLVFLLEVDHSEPII